MGFNAEQKAISKLINDAIYEIPRNQRKYVWGKEHWLDLFSDVIYAMENNSTHFIGSVVLKVEEKENGLDKYTIIDGQQRIMTITMFLAAIMYKFKQLNMIDSAQGMLKHFKANDNKGQAINIIETEYHHALAKIVDKVCSSTHEDIKKTSFTVFVNLAIIDKKHDQIIADCFKFFIDQLSQTFGDDKRKIASAFFLPIAPQVLAGFSGSL